MDAEEAKKAQLVEAVADHELVSAAALLDERGRIVRLEGNAKVFRNGDPIDDEGNRVETDEGHEDVFLEAVGEHYLVVVFPARQDFDPIQQEVEELLERLDL